MRHIGKSIFLFFAAVAAVMWTGCRVNDIRTTEIKVSGLNNEKDAGLIENSLKKLPGSGFLKTEFDFTNGVVRITYNSMSVGTKNLEYAISEAGYSTVRYPAKTASSETK